MLSLVMNDRHYLEEFDYENVGEIIPQPYFGGDTYEENIDGNFDNCEYKIYLEADDLLNLTDLEKEFSDEYDLFVLTYKNAKNDKVYCLDIEGSFCCAVNAMDVFQVYENEFIPANVGICLDDNHNTTQEVVLSAMNHDDIESNSLMVEDSNDNIANILNLDNMHCIGSKLLYNRSGESVNVSKNENEIFSFHDIVSPKENVPSKSQKELLERIRYLLLFLFKSSQIDEPFLEWASAAADNIDFVLNIGFLRMKRFYSRCHGKSHRYGLLLNLLERVEALLRMNSSCTIRDLYYQDPEFFQSMSRITAGLNDISCMLGVPRWRLGVFASSKGLIAGEISWIDKEGETFSVMDTFNQYCLVPACNNEITSIQSNANFVLVVEKDASFQKLLSKKILQKFHPCIVITGKGYPDLNTKLLLHRIWVDLKIPILGLIDADPHGIEILSVYRFGSLSSSYMNEYLVTPIRWIGVLPSDLERFSIPESVLLPMIDGDYAKIDVLEEYCPIASWKNELKILRQLRRKAEIQCLDEIAENFLTDFYLVEKIKHGLWL